MEITVSDILMYKIIIFVPETYQIMWYIGIYNFPVNDKNNLFCFRHTATSDKHKLIIQLNIYVNINYVILILDFIVNVNKYMAA